MTLSVVAREVFNVVTVSSLVVVSYVVSVDIGAFDVVLDVSLVVPSTVVTVAEGEPEVLDVEPSTAVVDPVGEREFAVEESAVSDIVEVVVVDITGVGVLLSIGDVSVSVFIEDDVDVPSELDVVLFVVVDGSMEVVSFASVEMVCVADVSVSVVFTVDTDKLDSMAVASSVVDSDAVVDDVVWVDTNVDGFVDIPLEVIILIVEVSTFCVVLSTPVEVVTRVGVTLSVVELSSVLL